MFFGASGLKNAQQSTLRTMPYQNEHAARQQPPGKFGELRRGKVAGHPAGVSVFCGAVDGQSEIQSVRFDAEKWEPAEAKAWLKKHGMKSALEEATGKTMGFQVAKVQEDQRVAYGWLYVCTDKAGKQVVDHSGEVISIDEIWQAAHKYVMDGRDGGVMHSRGADGKVKAVAKLVASMVFTKELAGALGIPDGVVPQGWLVGYFYHDDETWNRVKSGELRSFSLGGTAERKEVNNGN